ncbi:50S ribosomal protein L9 [bacterium]|nr:MAG: 50S ribosomal protein L9 [bacterium]MCL4231496.1 50S ribosomal protein L9 [Dehalococcoidia bacterium]
MKVVFFEDVQGTAQVGDVKEVKNGFARNFLLPRGLAGPTTKDNLQHAQALAQKEARRQEKLDGDARKIADRLAGYTVTLEARVGESGRLFGSITNRDIAEKLHAATQLEIDPHLVLLPEPIRELGAREVTIKFTRNVTVDVTVDVQPDEESKPVVEKLLAEKKAAEAAEAKRAAEAAYAAEAAEKSARGGYEPEDAE